MSLAVLLGLGSGAAWADDGTSTLTFTAKCNGSGTADDGASWTVASDGTESNFDNTKGIHYGTNSAQVQYIRLSTSDISGTITEVVVNASTASGVTATASVTVGGNTFGGSAQSLTTSAANYTFTGSASGEIVVTVTKPSKAAKAIYVKSIAVTYSTGGTPTLDDSDLALTGAPIALNFDLYNNSASQEISYTTSSTGAVTVSESDYVTTSVDAVNKKITVSPKSLVTPSTQTITVSQAADKTYNAGAKTFTVTITDSTPIPTHTVTFNVNGNATGNEVEEGASIDFPTNIADIYGKKFVGWVATPIDGTTDVAPSFVTSATMGNADITYYAVFAEVVEGTSTTETLTYDASQDNGFPKAYAASDDYNLDGVSFNITQIFDKDTYFQWRAQGNSNGTGALYNNEALNVQTIVITYTDGDSNKNISLKVGNELNPTEGTSIIPSSSGNVYTFDCSNDNNGYFVLTNGSGAGYTSSIVITYKSGTPDTYSAYCTSVVAAAVATPVITIATNPFLFSTTATITCATDGATIYYSFDNENWTEYTDDLNITATTTIYAKATKDTDESHVATVTATKNLAEPTVAVSGDLTEDLDGETNVIAGTLTAAVTYNEVAVQGAVVAWSSSDTDIATIDANTGAVTLLATGEVTFTATYAGNNDYAAATGTKTITVIDSNVPGASPENPYSVAAAIEATPASGTSDNVYIRGIVSEFYNTSITSDGKNYRYYISDDGTTTDQLLVYKGKGLNEEPFTSDEDLQIGDEVIIYGGLTTYNSAAEVASGNYVYSLSRKEAATITVNGGTEFSINRENNEEELQLTATANSGATVVFTVDTENTTLDAGNYEFEDGLLLVSGNTAGVIVIKANAPAAGNYNAATEVTITVNILGVKSDATIVVKNDNVAYGSTYTIDDSMIEGGAITVTSSNEAIATVSGLTITPAAVGTTTITVSTAETAEYKAGSETFELTVTAPAGKTEAPAGNTTLFAESFGNNTGSARNWDDSYSVKSGVAAVYSGITGYTVSNAKQGKNTTGSTDSGLNQSTSGTDAYIIIGPLNVADYSDMTLTYQWKAASTKGTYTTSAYYATSSEGEYTEMSGTGDGATTFVERSYSVPAAAQVSTLYLKIVWNTSNTQAIIDEVQLTASGTASTTVQLNTNGYGTFCSVNPMDFSATEGYTTWRITSIDMNGSTGTINCEKITDAIKGGQGVLLYNKNAGGVQTEATINFADGDTEFDDVENLLRGTTAPTFVEAGEVYGLSGNAFVPNNADGIIPAGKAYLEATSIPAGVKAFIFMFNDEATGITETRTATRDEVESIFNIGGQRMSKMQRGVNIVKGKKILVK